MAARALGWITGLGLGPALMVMANGCALAAMAALLILVRNDLGDGELARRSMWLLALAPAAYSLVLGYADGPPDVVLDGDGVGGQGPKVVGGGGGRAGGGTGAPGRHPVGGARAHRGVPGPARRGPGRPVGGSSAAAAAPVAGTVAYLVWVRSQFGDLWLPFRVQQEHGHRGVITLPLAAMGHNLESVVHGHHLGSALHIPWVVLSVALLVVAFRRLPLSYAAFAAAVLVVSLASSNLDSFERYALGAFPAGGRGLDPDGPPRGGARRLGASGSAMAGYAVLAFLGIVVP